MGMGSTTDKATGVIKETAGGMTNNEELRRAGQRQQAKAELQHQASSMSKHAHDATFKAVNRVSDAVHRRT